MKICFIDKTGKRYLEGSDYYNRTELYAYIYIYISSQVYLLVIITELVNFNIFLHFNPRKNVLWAYIPQICLWGHLPQPSSSTSLVD